MCEHIKAKSVIISGVRGVWSSWAWGSGLKGFKAEEHKPECQEGARTLALTARLVEVDTQEQSGQPQACTWIIEGIPEYLLVVDPKP